MTALEEIKESTRGSLEAKQHELLDLVGAGHEQDTALRDAILDVISQALVMYKMTVAQIRVAETIDEVAELWMSSTAFIRPRLPYGRDSMRHSVKHFGVSSSNTAKRVSRSSNEQALKPTSSTLEAMISPDELEAWAKLHDGGYYSFEPDASFWPFAHFVARPDRILEKQKMFRLNQVLFLWAFCLFKDSCLVPLGGLRGGLARNSAIFLGHKSHRRLRRIQRE